MEKRERAVKPGDPVPESPVVTDLRELVVPTGRPPDPPACVAKRLKERDLMWRWLSEPAVRRLGMRMYVAYSPTSEEREMINSGRDTPPGVHVDEQNRVKWMDDAFLGVIPRRLYLARQAQKSQRIADLTAASRDYSGLREAAARIGGRVSVEARSWEAPETDTREP